MEQILKGLKRRDIVIKDLKALEVFGRCGEWHTKDYAPQVSELDVWEIESKYKEKLKKNLPKAEVKITDSYEEITRTEKKFNLIVVDNTLSFEFGHCEHFDLFPDIFRIVMDSAILILNVIHQVKDGDLIKRTIHNLFDEKQLECRKSFYQTDRPEKIFLEKIINIYKDLITKNGFFLDWYFFQKRISFYYLVLKISKPAVKVLNDPGV